MGKLVALAVASVTAATLGASAPALAASHRQTASGAHRGRTHVEVVVSTMRSPDGAKDRLDSLADLGQRDFRIERTRNDRFEVERPFRRLLPALRELRMLRRHGIHAHLELSR